MSSNTAIESKKEYLSAIKEVDVKIVLEKGGVVPKYQTSGSSGIDLHSTENIKIKHGCVALVSTGLKIEVPEGHEIQIRSRSGNALKKGLFVLNSPGTIDSDYRGFISVILANFSNKDEEVKVGDRIAQAILTEYRKMKINVVDSLSSSKRGDKGFGHTGF